MNKDTISLKEEEYEKEEITLKKGDVLFYFSEEPYSSRLFLTQNDSWAAFIAHMMVYIIHNQYIFDQCVNEFIKNMSFEEKMNFKYILTDQKYAH